MYQRPSTTSGGACPHLSNDVNGQKPIALMIDNNKGDNERNPETVWDELSIQSTTESVRNDWKVKEMIIGVGSGQFM